MKLGFVAVVVGLSCAVSGTGRAAVLASGSISAEVDTVTPNSGKLDVGFAENTSSSFFLPQAAPGSVQIFTGLSVGAADVGSTFTATSASDPHFDAFAAYLTDGVSQEIAYSLTYGPGASGSASHRTESQYVWGAFADPRIDLHGYRIDSATVTVNGLTANQYSAADNSYHTSGTVTLSIQGVLLPEPTCVTPALPAAAGVLCRRRRRRE